MEIYKAPTLRLKTLNNHSITHIMYSEMENVVRKKKNFHEYKTANRQMHCVSFHQYNLSTGKIHFETNTI